MIGSFGSEIVFFTSSFMSRTFKNFSESSGSKFAEHSLIEGKPRKQYIGANLKKISFDITLRADLGMRPRVTLEKLKKLAESGEAKYLIIGGRPISNNPFIVTEISDKWGVVFNLGQLYSCDVSLTLEEYPAYLQNSRIK